MQLYEALSMQVAAWREDGYKHEEFPAIAEILEWARHPDVPTFHLRAPQFRALETYWFLRLVEETPHVFDLYQNLFPKVTDRLTALGIIHPDMREMVLDIGYEGLIEKIRSDDEFVRQYKLEAVRETLTYAEGKSTKGFPELRLCRVNRCRNPCSRLNLSSITCRTWVLSRRETTSW